MNRTQKGILLAAIILVLLTGVFPPWRAVVTAGLNKGIVQDHYYGWIIQPGQYTTGYQIFTATAVQLDTAQLYAHWVLITLVAGGLLVYFQDNKR